MQTGKELNSNNLKIAKEQWIVKQRYKKVKLENCIDKRKRRQGNIKTKKAFSKHWKEARPKKGKCLGLRNSSNFRVVFGRKTKEKEVKILLREKVTIIAEFTQKMSDTEKLMK